jgi:hypothetical protein
VEKLSIDLGDRSVRTRDCSSCAEPVFLIDGIVRMGGRACFPYGAWVHVCGERGSQALVDVAVRAEWSDLNDADGPDFYCDVFSCCILDGELAVIDAPGVVGADLGHARNLRLDEARAHGRYGEWREVLALILDVETASPAHAAV